MRSIAEQIHEELASVPEPLQREVLDFLRFLRERAERHAQERGELLQIADASWSAEWDNDAEDEAWATL